MLAYNQGHARIDKAIETAGSAAAWDVVARGGLNKEGRDYLPRFYSSLAFVIGTHRP